ncbi:MAG: excinuclease ABC subunit UvrC [Chlamydiales bacterium]|nr:excinuclease ABC subunit UvrC [Chlamydiales bacterium]
MPYDSQQIDAFPLKPGVYIMKGRYDSVLYIGKANNLRARVKQYFVPGRDSREMVPHLVAQVQSIEIIVVSSEKEALLLENTLIKEHQPRYNAIFRDDKTYISLKIDNKHQWPIVHLVRYKGRAKPDGLYFGPYTSAYAARQTLDLIHKVFPLRQCSDQELARRTRPCILYDMKRCVAPCVGLCSKEEYDEKVRTVIKFLRGQNQEVVRELKRDMEEASAKLEFERAGVILSTIRHIEATIETQRVVKVNGHDSDFYGVFREGEEVMVSQVIFRGGRMMGTKNFGFSGLAQDDAELLESLIMQKSESADEIPDEILLPVNLSDHEALEEILTAKKEKNVAVHCPLKGDKKRVIEIARENAEAAYRREKDAKVVMEKMLTDMQEQLQLENYPRRIECFDNSHLSGTDPVSSLVAFTDGEKDTKRYRLYKIKTAEAADDYGAMREVLSRRYRKAKEENNLPDLIIVDGGKGQLNMAHNVLEELDIATVDLIGIAKDQGRHDKGVTAEQIFLVNIKDPVRLRSTSPVMFLLQKIRDEAHRSALAFQQKRRSKGTIRSALDDVEGIGPKKRQILLRHFGSVAKLKEATEDELKAVPGISQSNAKALREFFSKD